MLLTICFELYIVLRTRLYIKFSVIDFDIECSLKFQLHRVYHMIYILYAVDFMPVLWTYIYIIFPPQTREP